ncbi:MAG: response regulator, partial [Phycisphaerales bacterium]|nr:response regulator [Phycisphaerales bacterium]
DLFLETFDVRQVVLDIAGTVQPLVEKGGNALIVECEARIGFMYADKTRIRQTLFNLLSNASRFTERGTITLTVEEVDFRGVEGLRFNVRDTGIGIPEDTIDRLFEAFTQGDQTPSRRYGGTGLGLAISRHFCAMMGGTLTAQSVVGEGSMFTIVLPRHVVDESARPEDDLLLRAQEDGGEALKAATTVLVIDDDPTVHDLMRRFLAREGYAVHSALTGRDGVQLAKTLHPDVITLDVMMPTMDGWAVLTELKSDPAVAAIPVVMVTMVQDEPMGYALGADEFLVKPIRRARLLDTLSRYRVGSGGLVLVVDDDTDARAMLSRMVSQEGWSVEQAANGVEALARLRRRQPDVILLDLMMPEMDGFEVLEHLQEDPEWREIPVIIVTAMTLAPDDLERLRGHIDRVLQKGTFTKDELLEGVAAVLRRVSEDLQRSQTG